MDRRRPRPSGAVGFGRLILAAGRGLWAAAAGVLALAAAPQHDAPLRAMRWAPPTADPVATFGRTPTECLRIPGDAAGALSVEVGRAAFRTPLALGGQAARAGVACETCHTAGRRNATFLFPGVSGAPGTADVTDSLFSSHRGDGVDNPKRIPDLSGPKSGLKVDQDPKAAALEAFIHGLITQEFDGDEPPKAVVAGLADYVRHLSPDACPAAATRAVTPGYFLDDARRALRTAQGKIARGDVPTAILMIGAARSRLGLIDERYADPALAPLRGELRAFDRRLEADQAALRAGRPGSAADLGRWIADSRGLQRRLEARVGDSLFDPARLTAASRRRLRG